MSTPLPLLAAAATEAASAAPVDSPLAGLVGWTVDFGIVVIVAGMLMCLWRLVRGPHFADRALAVDTIGVELIGLVILFSIRFETVMFFDGILVLSLLGFAGTVAMAQYVARERSRAAESEPSKEGSES